MLRPSELGITGIKRTIKQHQVVLTNSLVRMLKVRNRQAIIADVCLKIMQASNGSKIDVSSLNISEVNEIKNYFGEAMGPIWCYQGLLPGVKFHDQCLFEPGTKLYDFKVYRGSEPTLISNKTRGKYTNTLKPGDVVRLINENQDLYRKWSGKSQFRAFEILNESNVVSGPIKVISKFYPNLVRVSQNDYANVIRQLTSNDVIVDQVPESIMLLISNDPRASAMYDEKEEVTGTMINFIFEKLLIKQSQDDTTYHDIFVDATQGNIQILKFNLSLGGLITYSLEEPKENKGQALFRSKQGIERRSNTGALKLDKIGLTIP